MSREPSEDCPFKKHQSRGPDHQTDKMQICDQQQNPPSSISNPSLTVHHNKRKSDRLSSGRSPARYNDIDYRFAIETRLGEGAYGTVYKAFDKKTNKVSIISREKCLSFLKQLNLMEIPIYCLE